MRTRHPSIYAVATVTAVLLLSHGATAAESDESKEVAHVLHQLQTGNHDEVNRAHRELKRLVRENPERRDLIQPLLRLATQHDRGDTQLILQLLKEMAAGSPDQFAPFVPAIAKIAGGKLPEEQWEAIGLLGAISQSPKSVIDQLSAIARESARSNPLLTIRAFGAIEQLEPSVQHLQELLEYTDRKDPDMRAAAAYALGQMNAKHQPQLVVDTLVTLMRDESTRVRVLAADGYRRCGGKSEEIVPVLLDALKEPDDVVRLRKKRFGEMAITQRFCAIGGLVQVGAKTPDVLAELRVATKDEDPLVRLAAEHALRRLTP